MHINTDKCVRLKQTENATDEEKRTQKQQLAQIISQTHTHLRTNTNSIYVIHGPHSSSEGVG